MDNRCADAGQQSPRPIRVGSYLACAAVLWTLAVGTSLLWVRDQDYDTLLEDARIQARTAVAKDVAYRRWNAIRGGVYARVAEDTQPNPHLRVEGREITTPGGSTLTLINPAYMTRQVHELEQQQTGMRNHITSLRPIRPQNAADPWETEALRALERGDPEVSSVVEIGGQQYMRLMRSLKVEESCLKCHGFQGYKMGDVRGGIGVVVPLAPLIASMKVQERADIFGHGALWVLGLVGMVIGSLRLRRRILERDRAEALLRQAKSEAEQANKFKSEFLANMSHEIRTPMTAILGFAENLLDVSLVAEEKTEAIGAIRRNGLHLLTVINDILDLSKIEAGKLEVERISCLPGQVLDEVATMVRAKAQSKNLTLSIDDSQVHSVSIQTDPTRLRQVLINLATNAVKFTEEGEVRLVARLLSAPAENPGFPLSAAVQFEITDTGIGMTPEQAARLFRPFMQADGSVTRRFGGTGLGLVISKRLIELMGGCITLESRPGKGTTVRVTLPMDRQQEVMPASSSSDAAAHLTGRVASCSTDQPLRHTRVLLAEDGPDNQKLISFVLRRAGAEIDVSDNGRQALELARNATAKGAPYDVILMDMHMPVMDGYTATRSLREGGYDGLIIALTAHAMSDARGTCLDAGCDDFATKPIDRAELIATIARHVCGPVAG